MGAIVLASVVTALVVLVTIVAFLWAAREDGRAQRRRDAWRRPR
jgi:nitrogen fixation-related uncharacterized protein